MGGPTGSAGNEYDNSNSPNKTNSVNDVANGRRTIGSPSLAGHGSNNSNGPNGTANNINSGAKGANSKRSSGSNNSNGPNGTTNNTNSGANGANSNSTNNMNGGANISTSSSANKTAITQNTPQQQTPPTATIPSSNTLRIDQKQWTIIEWFGCGECWQNDFAKWIILVLEERTTSEKNNIETGLTIIKREIDEIYKVGMMSPECYEVCSNLITKCRHARINFDKEKRNELLNITFGLIQMEFDKANSVVNTLAEMSVEQRTILRFMVHQKVQARIAFLRTTLKTHRTTYEMERYHCVTNPYYDDMRKQYTQSMDECKELRANINIIKASNSELSNKYSELKKDYNEEIDINIKISQELTQENTSLKEQLKAKEEEMTKREKVTNGIVEGYKRTTQERDRMKLEYEESITQFQEEADKLRKQAKTANIEASNYQAALGSAKNVRWSDSTLNNPIQLTKDIENFQHSLADFTKVKGKYFKVNEDAAKQLLTSYGCKLVNVNTREIKNYLAAALQRMVLEIIFNYANNLYKMADNADDYSDAYLEPYIVYYSHHLNEYINLLATKREGQDSLTAITPIKIRQQVYAALGSRGFAKSKHPIIRKLVKEISSKIEKYREVVDESKKDELRSDAEKIVRDGMQLWFCLKAQEPMPKIHWFESSDRLEPHLMVGSWENENVKELEVDFTILPLIITEHDHQVFSKAQVFVRSKGSRFPKIF